MCFSGRGSSVLVKSAMLLDLEFQHGIYLSWPGTCLSLYPCFLPMYLLFPLPRKIQPCLTACISPKLILLCFCIFSQSSSRIGFASTLAGKLWVQRLCWMALLAFQLPSCSAIDHMFLYLTYWLRTFWGQWQYLILHFYLQVELSG